MPAPATDAFADYPADLRAYLEAAPDTRSDEEHLRFMQSLTEEQRDYIAWYKMDSSVGINLYYKWPSQTLAHAVTHLLDLSNPDGPWAQPGHEAVFTEAGALLEDIYRREKTFQPEIMAAHREAREKREAAYAKMMADPPEPLFDSWIHLINDDVGLLRYLTNPHRLNYLAEQEARGRVTGGRYEWENEDAQMMLMGVRSVAEDAGSPAGMLAAQWLKLFEIKVTRALPDVLQRVPEQLRTEVLNDQAHERYVQEVRAQHPARGKPAALARGEAEEQQLLIDAIRRDHPEMHIWSDEDIRRHPETAMNALLELKQAKKATELPPL